MQRAMVKTGCVLFASALFLTDMTVPSAADETEDLIFTELLEVQEDQGRLGDYGRLIIPEVGVNVALFYADDNLDNQAQVLTDAQDSAVFMPWVDDQYMIADHWTQGFINIKDCREGTRAYIKKEDCIEMYVCTEMTTGNNLVYSFLIDTQKEHVYKPVDGQPAQITSETLTETDGSGGDPPETVRPAGAPVLETDAETAMPGSGTIVGETIAETEEDTESDVDAAWFTTPHEWTGYYELETREGETDFETETEIFWGQPLEYIEDFDLFMYTCNGRWRDVFIGLFSFVDVFPL